MTRRRSEEPTTITAYPDGPLLLRGPAEILGEAGQPLERKRATVALCRCGLSAIAPLCDGTHKAAQRAEARRAERRAHRGRRATTPS